MNEGVVVWLTGLPSCGKSTLAARIGAELRCVGVGCVVLDGDEVRAALVPTPGYTPEARGDFYATLGRLAALLARQGLVVLVPATAHRRAFREEARRAAPRFLEVWVRASREECARRDPKGLYASARAGKVKDLPGAGVEYEAPLAPDVVAEGGLDRGALVKVLDLVGRFPGSVRS